MSIKGVILFLILSICGSAVFATHNRAGEILYKRVGSDPFLYEITIITYTKTGGQSDEADRCELDLFFGDGQMETVARVNGPSSQDCNHAGEQIAPSTKMNIYRTTHIYPGTGRYVVYMQDQNRNGGVKNIPDSEGVWFHVSSEIVIDPSTGGNTAPILSNPPIDNACLDEVYYHNPGAVDPDGDSLVYSLADSRTMDGQAIPGFVMPNMVSGSSQIFEIDPRTGTLTWDSPQQQGEYNVAIRIEEWRYLETSGQRIYVGYVLRDMQIDVRVCEPKEPPVINDMAAVCIEAGQQLRQLAIATDADDDNLEFSATGFPLEEGQGGFIDTISPLFGRQPLEMEFIWDTRCDHVQFEPYWVYFKAKEDLFGSDEELVDFEELEIKVVPPAVTITDIRPVGASISLAWSQAICEGADGYDIYRYNDSLGFVGEDCNVGVPESLGYEKVGRTEGLSSTSFIDDNDGLGLIHGKQYCYMIVVTYPDRSESYASLERCSQLIRDVPILNKVSVVSTEEELGVDSIAWFKPTELKTDVFLPPYRYQLSRAFTLDGNYEIVYTSPPADSITGLDTIYRDTGLNTLNRQYFYSISMLSGEEERITGSSRNAASIFLSSTPADNRLTLTWDVDVPWENTEYIVYRFSTDEDSLDSYQEIGRTSGLTFVDDSLKNLQEYRYFVKSIGSYSSDDFSDSLYLVNLSQIHTGIPEDTEIPCTPPNRIIVGDCNLDETEIKWNNPNTSCEFVDDVLSYTLYFASQLGERVELIQVNDDPLDTTYFRQTDESIAGCYFITSVDSFGNESELGEPLCIDNCPIYELPNVFTPGNDGRNDVFEPYPYKYIESIDLVIFNRWGREVFKTTNPDIQWDGTAIGSGSPVPDGTYYYMCTVNEIRLEGIVSRELNGSIMVLNEKTSGNQAN
ncbi:MAG: hypothetical protein Salg2KO_17480 [Salibacteraceae bacterium]